MEHYNSFTDTVIALPVDTSETIVDELNAKYEDFRFVLANYEIICNRKNVFILSNSKKYEAFRTIGNIKLVTEPNFDIRENNGILIGNEVKLKSYMPTQFPFITNEIARKSISVINYIKNKYNISLDINFAESEYGGLINRTIITKLDKDIKSVTNEHIQKKFQKFYLDGLKLEDICIKDTSTISKAVSLLNEYEIKQEALLHLKNIYRDICVAAYKHYASSSKEETVRIFEDFIKNATKTAENPLSDISINIFKSSLHSSFFSYSDLINAISSSSIKSFHEDKEYSEMFQYMLKYNISDELNDIKIIIDDYSKENIDTIVAKNSLLATSISKILTSNFYTKRYLIPQSVDNIDDFDSNHLQYSKFYIPTIKTGTKRVIKTNFEVANALIDDESTFFKYIPDIIDINSDKNFIEIYDFTTIKSKKLQDELLSRSKHSLIICENERAIELVKSTDSMAIKLNKEQTLITYGGNNNPMHNIYEDISDMFKKDASIQLFLLNSLSQKVNIKFEDIALKINKDALKIKYLKSNKAINTLNEIIHSHQISALSIHPFSSQHNQKTLNIESSSSASQIGRMFAKESFYSKDFDSATKEIYHPSFEIDKKTNMYSKCKYPLFFDTSTMENKDMIQNYILLALDQYVDKLDIEDSVVKQMEIQTKNIIKQSQFIFLTIKQHYDESNITLEPHTFFAGTDEDMEFVGTIPIPSAFIYKSVEDNKFITDESLKGEELNNYTKNQILKGFSNFFMKQLIIKIQEVVPKEKVDFLNTLLKVSNYYLKDDNFIENISKDMQNKEHFIQKFIMPIKLLLRNYVNYALPNDALNQIKNILKNEKNERQVISTFAELYKNSTNEALKKQLYNDLEKYIPFDKFKKIKKIISNTIDGKYFYQNASRNITIALITNAAIQKNMYFFNLIKKDIEKIKSIASKYEKKIKAKNFYEIALQELLGNETIDITNLDIVKKFAKDNPDANISHLLNYLKKMSSAYLYKSFGQYKEYLQHGVNLYDYQVEASLLMSQNDLSKINLNWLMRLGKTRVQLATMFNYKCLNNQKTFSTFYVQPKNYSDILGQFFDSFPILIPFTNFSEKSNLLKKNISNPYFNNEVGLNLPTLLSKFLDITKSTNGKPPQANLQETYMDDLVNIKKSFEDMGKKKLEEFLSKSSNPFFDIYFSLKKTYKNINNSEKGFEWKIAASIAIYISFLEKNGYISQKNINEIKQSILDKIKSIYEERNSILDETKSFEINVKSGLTKTADSTELKNKKNKVFTEEKKLSNYTFSSPNDIDIDSSIMQITEQKRLTSKISSISETIQKYQYPKNGSFDSATKNNKVVCYANINDISGTMDKIKSTTDNFIGFVCNTLIKNTLIEHIGAYYSSKPDVTKDKYKNIALSIFSGNFEKFVTAMQISITREEIQNQEILFKINELMYNNKPLESVVIDTKESMNNLSQNIEELVEAIKNRKIFDDLDGNKTIFYDELLSKLKTKANEATGMFNKTTWSKTMYAFYLPYLKRGIYKLPSLKENLRYLSAPMSVKDSIYLDIQFEINDTKNTPLYMPTCSLAKWTESMHLPIIDIFGKKFNLSNVNYEQTSKFYDKKCVLQISKKETSAIKYNIDIGLDSPKKTNFAIASKSSYILFPKNNSYKYIFSGIDETHQGTNTNKINLSTAAIAKVKKNSTKVVDITATPHLCDNLSLFAKQIKDQNLVFLFYASSQMADFNEKMKNTILEIIENTKNTSKKDFYFDYIELFSKDIEIYKSFENLYKNSEKISINTELHLTDKEKYSNMHYVLPQFNAFLQSVTFMLSKEFSKIKLFEREALDVKIDFSNPNFYESLFKDSFEKFIGRRIYVPTIGPYLPYFERYLEKENDSISLIKGINLKYKLSNYAEDNANEIVINTQLLQTLSAAKRYFTSNFIHVAQKNTINIINLFFDSFTRITGEDDDIREMKDNNIKALNFEIESNFPDFKMSADVFLNSTGKSGKNSARQIFINKILNIGTNPDLKEYKDEKIIKLIKQKEVILDSTIFPIVLDYINGHSSFNDLIRSGISSKTHSFSKGNYFSLILPDEIMPMDELRTFNMHIDKNYCLKKRFSGEFKQIYFNIRLNFDATDFKNLFSTELMQIMPSDTNYQTIIPAENSQINSSLNIVSDRNFRNNIKNELEKGNIFPIFTTRIHTNFFSILTVLNEAIHRNIQNHIHVVALSSDHEANKVLSGIDLEELKKKNIDFILVNDINKMQNILDKLKKENSNPIIIGSTDSLSAGLQFYGMKPLDSKIYCANGSSISSHLTSTIQATQRPYTIKNHEYVKKQAKTEYYPIDIVANGYSVTTKEKLNSIKKFSEHIGLLSKNFFSCKEIFDIIAHNIRYDKPMKVTVPNLKTIENEMNGFAEKFNGTIIPTIKTNEEELSMVSSSLDKNLSKEIIVAEDIEIVDELIDDEKLSNNKIKQG